MKIVKWILFALLLICFIFLSGYFIADYLYIRKPMTESNGQVISKAQPTVSKPIGKIYGVNMSGGEFGEESLPGVLNTNYLYPRETKKYQYFAAKRIPVIRLPIRWERVQQSAFGELHTPDINQLKRVLDTASAHNMKVIIDLHNFGRFYGQALTQQDANKLADVWGKLAVTFKDHPGLYGYELMNEPHDLEGGSVAWTEIAQYVTAEIRKVDKETLIIIPGYNWQNAQNWTKNNPGLPLKNTDDNLIYSAHIYFDSTYNGKYAKSFDEDKRNTNIGVTESSDFREWLHTNNVKGIFTEFGVPDNDPRWLSVMDLFLESVQEDPHIMGAIYWSAGPWWKDYLLSIEPQNGSERPQMQILQKYTFTQP